jgi:hypothetical protein
MLRTIFKHVSFISKLLPYFTIRLILEWKSIDPYLMIDSIFSWCYKCRCKLSRKIIYIMCFILWFITTDDYVEYVRCSVGVRTLLFLKTWRRLTINCLRKKRTDWLVHINKRTSFNMLNGGRTWKQARRDF